MKQAQRLQELVKRLQQHTKAELQALCCKLNKSTVGTKEDLILRLLT